MHRLRQPNMRRKIRSIDNDYAKSKERISDLQVPINIGIKAESIIEFVEAFMDDTEELVLEKLRNQEIAADDVRLYYMAAINFTSKVRNAVSEGKRAKEKQAKLIDERQKRREKA